MYIYVRTCISLVVVNTVSLACGIEFYVLKRYELVCFFRHVFGKIIARGKTTVSGDKRWLR